jgi:hypothetical protein
VPRRRPSGEAAQGRLPVCRGPQPAGQWPRCQAPRCSRRPTIPVACRPGASPGCEAPLTGRARARATACVSRVYLPLTSHGPGRETAGQQRI